MNTRDRWSLAKPTFDARPQRLSADTVLVVQGRQRARVQELVRESGQFELGGLNPVSQERTCHGLPEPADDGVVFRDDDKPVLVPHRLNLAASSRGLMVGQWRIATPMLSAARSFATSIAHRQDAS